LHLSLNQSSVKSSSAVVAGDSSKVETDDETGSAPRPCRPLSARAIFHRDKQTASAVCQKRADADDEGDDEGEIEPQ